MQSTFHTFHRSLLRISTKFSGATKNIKELGSPDGKRGARRARHMKINLASARNCAIMRSACACWREGGRLEPWPTTCHN